MNKIVCTFICIPEYIMATETSLITLYSFDSQFKLVNILFFMKQIPNNPRLNSRIIEKKEGWLNSDKLCYSPARHHHLPG